MQNNDSFIYILFIFRCQVCFHVGTYFVLICNSKQCQHIVNNSGISPIGILARISVHNYLYSFNMCVGIPKLINSPRAALSASYLHLPLNGNDLLHSCPASSSQCNHFSSLPITWCRFPNGSIETYL